MRVCMEMVGVTQIQSIWKNCAQDLNRVKEAISELNLFFTRKNDNSEILVGVMHSHLRQIFLNCFRRKRNLFDAFEQGLFEIHYHKYLKFFFSLPKDPRRNLAFIPFSGPSHFPGPIKTGKGGEENHKTINIAFVITVAEERKFIRQLCSMSFGYGYKGKPLLSLSREITLLAHPSTLGVLLEARS